MERINTRKLLIAGIALILGALLVAGIGPAVSVLAQSIQGNQGNTAQQAAGQNHCQGSQGTTEGNSDMMGNGMMGGGMMGGGMGRMMGDVDRHFIEMMIPHHQDAIAMAELALQRSQHPQIKTLAADIKRVQQAEIDQMQTWYRQWYGTEVPRSNSGGNMMGGGMMGMGTGMGMGMNMDLDALANAADFDKTFIEMMIPHHRMALMMSNMVLVGGEKAELRTLAGAIISGQSAEIEQMQTWYRTWYGTDVGR